MVFVKLLIMAVGMIFLAACGRGGTTGDSQGLRMALLIDDGSPQSGILFEDFRAGLEAHIGMPVIPIEGVPHLVGIEAMRAGNLDVMWGPPFTYLLARQATDVVRLAVTENPDAVNKTVFITSRDDIHSLHDLHGRSFAFITAASTSGFLYPMYELMTLFNMSRDEIMAGGLFSTVAFSGSQDASIMGVVHGDFDAAAVGNLNLQSIIASGLVDANNIRIIGSTEIIPFPGYIAAGHLPNEIIEKIREFIISYDNEEYFAERFGDANTRFVEPDVNSILHLESMVRALDIDLE